MNQDAQAESLSDATSTVDVGTPDSDSLRTAIQMLAYEIFLSRGGHDGNDLADWLEAERVVLSDVAHIVD
jgi:hypothetical protein